MHSVALYLRLRRGVFDHVSCAFPSLTASPAFPRVSLPSPLVTLQFSFLLDNDSWILLLTPFNQDRPFHHRTKENKKETHRSQALKKACIGWDTALSMCLGES